MATVVFDLRCLLHVWQAADHFDEPLLEIINIAFQYPMKKQSNSIHFKITFRIRTG